MDEFKKLIKEKGERLTLQANSPFSLEERGVVWFLEHGSVNLFAIEKKEGKPEGRRTLLTTFSEPIPLFPFTLGEEASYEMIAITEVKSRLWKIPFETLEEALGREPKHVENWLNKLAEYYENEDIEGIPSYLAAPQKADIHPETFFSLKRAVTHGGKRKIEWIELQEGEADFMGYSSLPLPKGVFPLTYHGWIKGKSEGRIQVSAKTEYWKEGLFSFHKLFFAYLLKKKALEAQEEKSRLLERRQKEEEALQSSLQEMVSVLNPSEEFIKVHEVDPLFLACQLVGEASGLIFKKPADLPETGEVEDLFQQIAEESEIRFREVRLRGKWWRRDSGPLLAFQGREQKPVALIPKRPGVYELVDPETGEKTPIKENVAKTLSPIGYCFYVPFPKELKSGRELLKFYWKQNKKELPPVVWYSVLGALLALFTPFGTEILMNWVIPDNNLSLLWQISTGLFLAAISSSLFIFFRSLVVGRIEARSSIQIQSAVWDRVLHLPVSFFRKNSTGNLILRVVGTESIRSLLSGNATRALFSGIFSLFYLIAMVFYAPTLTLIASSLLFLGFLATFVCAAIYAHMQYSFNQKGAEINSFVNQLINSIAKIRTAGAEKHAFAKWGQMFAEYKKTELHSRHVENVVKGMNYVLPYLMYLGIFAYVIFSGHDYSVGSFIAFNTAFITFYVAMTDLSNTILSTTPAIPLWKRAKVLLEEPLEEKIKAKSPGKLRGEIHVDEICFTYEDNPNPTLDHVTLKANPREFIGIVGPSGCGKSTLLRLLLGFERPQSGAIYYDDKDLASFTTHEFRKQLGVVLQEEGILAGSVYENLTCGGRYTQDQIEHALEISGFAEDLNSFPMGLHTSLTTGGTTLSGGQRQRLLIARALLPNPQILLLDEATSALDNRNQKKVVESIDELDVTRIVIAHRISTIRNADRIYVMDKGRIVQSGTYEELSQQPGLFADMRKRQSL